MGKQIINGDVEITGQLLKGDLKALYHLGAYDSVDTSNSGYDVITRRTIWLNSKSGWARDPDANGLARFYIVIPKSVATNVITSNFPIVTAYSTGEGVCIIDDGEGGWLIGYKVSLSGNVCIPHDLEIQVQLASAYNETNIKNQPFSTLGQNGENWLRGEYEKTLNLFGQSLYQGGWNSPENSKYSNATRVCNDTKTPVEPNTTYTITNSGGKQISVQYRTSAGVVNGGTGWQESGVTFTTPNDCVLLDIIFRNSDNSNLTPSQVGSIMLNEGNHAYPYQPYDKFNGFLKDEYEKQLNLWSVSFGSVYWTADWYFIGARDASYFQPVKPNTTYTIALNEAKNFVVQYFDSSKTNITDTAQGLKQTLTFTTPSNCAYIRVPYVRNGSDISWVMLNEGDTAKPFVDFYGRIMHAIDVEGVLLWQNGNEDTSFATQTISVPNMSEFKYLMFGFKINSSATSITQYFKIKCKSSSGGYAWFSFIDDSSTDTYKRTIKINSMTSITFNEGYRNSSATSNSCIPTTIYGIK